MSSEDNSQDPDHASQKPMISRTGQNYPKGSPVGEKQWPHVYLSLHKFCWGGGGGGGGTRRLHLFLDICEKHEVCYP